MRTDCDEDWSFHEPEMQSDQRILVAQRIGSRPRCFHLRPWSVDPVLPGEAQERDDGEQYQHRWVDRVSLEEAEDRMGEIWRHVMFQARGSEVASSPCEGPGNPSPSVNIAGPP
jgi:hypothetical protein